MADAPCPRSPLRPIQFGVDCPACERTMLLHPIEWDQEPSGAYAAHGPERWPVCEYCREQFEVVAVQVVEVSEFSPELDAALAADSAIAASVAEWERTSGPPPGENSPADVLDRLDALAAWHKRGGPRPVQPYPGIYRTACDAAAEIGRLRVAIRVNGLRAGATDAEIDQVIYGKR